MRKRFIRTGAAAVVAALLVLSVGAASAQTQGMERRDERRDDRAGARDAKQDCKAGDEKTRAECRQEKRDTKQQGRQDGGQQNTAPRDESGTVTLGGRRPIGTRHAQELCRLWFTHVDLLSHRG
jgi:hypothetical protein